MAKVVVLLLVLIKRLLLVIRLRVWIRWVVRLKRNKISYKIRSSNRMSRSKRIRKGRCNKMMDKIRSRNKRNKGKRFNSSKMGS